MLKISKAIEEMRKIRGLSQTELSVRCGLQPSAISHFETGRRSPSAKNLVKLAVSLGTTTDYLVGNFVDPAAEFLTLYNSLTDHDRSTVFRMMQDLSKRTI